MTGDLPPSPRGADAQHERLAELIRTERGAILAAYASSLRDLASPIVTNPWAREQAMRDAAEIIGDVAAIVAGNEIRPGDHGEFPALLTGEAQADSRLGPVDLLRAASVFFEVTVRSLGRHVRADPDLLSCFVTAVVALNESIGRRIREATHAYAGLLLERVDQAHIEERRRIARDLHDQLGESMSVALRQFELYELASERDLAAGGAWAASLPGLSVRETPVPAPPARGESVREAITETMRRLRVVTSDLRQEAVRSLENSLVMYLDSVSSETDVRLRVSGNENWVPPAVIGEAFLITREAIRNALTHGFPQTLLIDIILAPHELHAWVEDDGCGFLVGEASAGIGLSSMRERAALLGGRLTVASTPGQGTQLELLIPLTEARDAHRE
ncbi:MAG TPA: ATP-binding protein [Streptosporangiaceae bacterium]|nr:ATP-binding protein [Streptosporangiaceae bacterium]